MYAQHHITYYIYWVVSKQVKGQVHHIVLCNIFLKGQILGHFLLCKGTLWGNFKFLLWIWETLGLKPSQASVIHVKAHKFVQQGYFFFHYFLPTSMTNWSLTKHQTCVPCPKLQIIYLRCKMCKLCNGIGKMTDHWLPPLTNCRKKRTKNKPQID